MLEPSGGSLAASMLGAILKSGGACQSFLAAPAFIITEKTVFVVSLIFFSGGACDSDAIDAAIDAAIAVAVAE